MQFRELQFNAEHLELLDRFQGKQPHSQFLQSSKWGNFQSKLGSNVKLFSDEKKEIIFLAIRQKLPLGFCYYYIPRGPYIEDAKTSKDFFQCLYETVHSCDPKAVFIRLEPISNLKLEKLIKIIDVQPSKTLLLSLKESEEKILAQMHQKTRYNIRLAEKKNLVLKINSEFCEQFLDLLEETKERDSFRIHSRSYYKTMIMSKTVDLVTIWNNNDLLAGSLLAKEGSTVTYLHGASSNKQRELMAPYFLHWHSIRRAKEEGYTWYDWQGIDEKKWPGVTRFKQGFGGQTYDFPGTFDLVLVSGVYAGYTIFRRIRRLFS